MKVGTKNCPIKTGTFKSNRYDMPNQTDLTFITNEENQSLLSRFRVLIRDTELFDVLVGYFYSSGFHALFRSLERTKHIRILIGISSDKETADWIKSAEQQELLFSHVAHAEVKERFSQKLIQEMDGSKDAKEVYDGVIKFMEWLRSGQLKIKAYPARNIHAKLYIMSFAEGDRDRGRVITGSSNFTRAGLTDNLEFNVELKNPSDYEFALQKFNTLWEEAVDIKDKYLETVQTKTWLNDSITPYQLYLKFLYEHFKEDLKSTEESSLQYMPQDFKQLEYQAQAVQNAKRILQEYGGVFLSDVVGLGKTYMSAMLAERIDGRSLVLAPPLLLDEFNPGSWSNVFSDFKIPAVFESLGQLDNIISRGTDKYKNVFIDEAHRFRKETNITYEKLAQICRGKRVILVTATPFNNTPLDILSQIKLFQSGKKSAIPNVSNLDRFFGELEKKIKNLNKKDTEYIKVMKENADKIRESVLKYLMVRRTRTEIEKYFADDLKSQNVKFPEVKDPEPVYYQFNKTENEVFHKTALLIGKKLKYARYIPLTYYKKQDQLQLDVQSQKNLGSLMRILLVKRLESSFYTFRNSISRFIKSYELFLREFKAGNVYVSKDYSNKIFDLLSRDDERSVQDLIDEEKAKKYPSADFTESLEKDLKNDLKILQEIKSLWEGINRDPKLSAFIDILSPSSSANDPQPVIPVKPVIPAKAGISPTHQSIQGASHLYETSNQTGINKFFALKDKKNKLIVFTESKETAEYLGEELNKKFPNEVLVFTGSSAESVKQNIIDNFDPRASNGKNDCRILIATDVLSEGVNLHRSNVIVNYDLPWNPTRLMQRAGRINRVDTKFDEIRVFNFFPTEQSNDIIQLEEIAKAKISAFINLLGADTRFLTNEEVPESHELFGRLSSKKTITGEEEEEESELKYLQVIKDIRDKDPDLFGKIKQLPKKARTAKVFSSGGTESSDGTHSNKFKEIQQQGENQLLTYFRKGKLNKFCIAGEGEAQELDFMSSAKLLESEKTTQKKDLPKDFYSKLEKNKEKFSFLTSEEEQPFVSSGSGRNNSSQLLKILKIIQKDLRQFTEDQEDYFKKVMDRLMEGALPKQTVNTALKAVEKETASGAPKPLKILALLQKHIPDEFLKGHISENSAVTTGLREVILSEYLISKQQGRKNKQKSS